MRLLTPTYTYIPTHTLGGLASGRRGTAPQSERAVGQQTLYFILYVGQSRPRGCEGRLYTLYVMKDRADREVVKGRCCELKAAVVVVVVAD